MNSVCEWRILQCTNSMFVWDGQSKEDKKDILHVQNREKSFSKEQKKEHFPTTRTVQSSSCSDSSFKE